LDVHPVPHVLAGVVGTLVGDPVDRDQGAVKDGEDAEAAVRRGGTAHHRRPDAAAVPVVEHTPPEGSLVGGVGWRCVILSVGALAWWLS
jgi:hypothetical protein